MSQLGYLEAVVRIEETETEMQERFGGLLLNTKQPRVYFKAFL